MNWVEKCPVENANMKIKKQCQYNYSNCQKTATVQHVVKLGNMRIDKCWACSNCQQIIEKRRQK